MVFESVRGYVELASGLGDLTRARALEAAQGLLSLPAAGVATGTKMAVQASALADELMSAAAANRENLTVLVRAEVDAAITRLGLVPVQRLERSRAEVATLRAEVAKLRSATPKAAAAPRSNPGKAAASKAAAPKAAPPKAAAPKSPAPKAAATKRVATKSTTTGATPKSAPRKVAPAKTAKKASTSGRSAVTTRVKPTGT